MLYFLEAITSLIPNLIEVLGVLMLLYLSYEEDMLVILS
jgi:hypothetical protein